MSDIIEEKDVPMEKEFDKDEFVPQEERKPKSFTITLANVNRCPKKSLSPQHYNSDGSCKCKK